MSSKGTPMKQTNEEIWTTLIQNGEVYSSYKVSNFGRVWNIKTNQEVSQVLSGKPQYKYVNLLKDSGERKQKRVNNIVAWSFLGAPPDKSYTADHIDQDKFNNCLSNIRWASKRTQANNRTCTVICKCGNNLSYLLEKYLPEDKDRARSFMSNYLKETDNDFEVLKQYYVAFLKYGLCWGKIITINGAPYKLFELLDQFNLDHEEVLELLNKGISFEGIVKGYTVPLPKNKSYDGSYEIVTEGVGMWFPSKTSLCNCYNLSIDTLNDRVRSGMSIEDALMYKPYHLWIDGFYMTRDAHCERLGVSLGRLLGKMSKHRISFEEALQLPLERVTSHCIDGIVKNNSEWYDYFNIPRKTANGYLSRHNKNFRKTLEHFGVDTYNMEIYPCDGNIVCLSKPL